METTDLNTIIDDSENKIWKNLFIDGSSYKNYSTVIVIATRGKKTESCLCECGKTVSIEYQMGFHPWVVEGWKRLIKPMNVPIIELVISGHEVGVAYEEAMEQILTNPQLEGFKYVLFMEDDVIIPYIPASYGALIELYKHLETYDVACGIYWTKGEPSLPLIYGDGNIKNPIPFKVNTNWRTGDVVEVNGAGMGFALMKRSIFEDKRLERPFFKSLNEVTPTGQQIGSTQDLYFYNKIKQLGYRICVDTNIRAGHLDIISEKVY